MTLSIWARPGNGRVYLSFDATAAGAKSFVLASNTNDIRFQENVGYGYTELNISAQTYTTGQWYLLEVEILSSTSAIGRLYGADGTTLLNSVTQTYSSIGSGGIALRSFGGFALDSLTVN